MPGFDKTGPRGSGPGYGWGLGPCGLGMRRGWGAGFGRGLRRAWTKKDEVVALGEEEKVLEEELKAVREEITALRAEK